MANIFGSETPVDQDLGSDTNDITLGVKWRSSVGGRVTAIRVYVGAGDPLTGAIYTSGGTLLGSVALSGLSGLGWSTVNFAAPIEIEANTVYVAAVYWPLGNYPVTSFGLDGATINGNLEALDNAESDNGVYTYGSGLQFPTSTWQATNYFSDVEFTADNTQLRNIRLAATSPAPPGDAVLHTVRLAAVGPDPAYSEPAGGSGGQWLGGRKRRRGGFIW